jgi:hypothetical protein
MKAVALISDPENEQQIRRFLLGELVAPDDNWDAETVDIVETELVDQYLRSELTSEESRQFQAHYLRQPGRRRKLEIAAAFQRSVRKPQRSRPLGAGATGLAAIALLAMIVVGYWRASTVTLYPGEVREIGTSYDAVRRLLPRRVRLALVDPIPPGTARVLLMNGAQEVWRTTLQLGPATEYLRIPLPTWQIPAGHYHLELQTMTAGQSSRTIASYPITID